MCIDSVTVNYKESPKHLKLHNLHEFLYLYNQPNTQWISKHNKNDLETPKSPELEKAIEQLYEEHVKQAVPEGTSKLVRSDKNHTIKIAFRNSQDYQYHHRNIVCINNQIREEFFADSKKTKTFNENNPNYVITSQDPELYNKWNTFINYLSNTLNEYYDSGYKDATDNMRQEGARWYDE